jgi:putative zinc finger/helix-turn-helix YgiT family protein
MPGCLSRLLRRIHELAVRGQVRFTLKAARELAALGAGLDAQDACDVLTRLTTHDFAERIESERTGEWMFIFKPSVAGTVVWCPSMRTNPVKSPRSKKAPHQARHRALADDACPQCGTMMLERRSALKLPVNGEETSVPSAMHLRCPKCDEVVLRFSDSRRLQEDAIAVYRKKHGLLSADEIRALRERFGLTQSELARLLHLGANTISRWESGRNVQTEAMEMLLRLIRDLPGSIDYLRRNAA